MKSRELRTLSIACLFVCSFLCAAIPASADIAGLPLNLSGSYLYDASYPGQDYSSDNPVSDQFGADLASNPYIGLDFRAWGDMTYDYSLNYDLSLIGNPAVYEGMTASFSPQLTFDSGSLTGSQNLDFSTNFDFKLDSFLAAADVSLSLPNLSLGDFGDAYLTTHGSGSINTSGSDASLLGGGLVKIETPSTSMSAWDTGADIIWILGQTNIPYVGPAMRIVDLAGFDLYTSIGMDIYRKDTAVLSEWSMPGSETFYVDVTTSSIVDGVFNYAVDATLDYSLLFVSEYQYGGRGKLTFDGPDPFFDSKELVDLSVGDPWGVGQLVSRLDVAVPVHLTYQAPVISYLDWWMQYAPFLPFNPPPPFELTPRIGGFSPFGRDHPLVEAVPEPSMLFLLGSGLLGLAGYGRRRLKK